LHGSYRRGGYECAWEGVFVFFKIPPKDPEGYFGMGHLLLPLPTCTLPKGKKERRKGNRATQNSTRSLFANSLPADLYKERQPLPRPKPQFVTTCPPTTNTLLV
jgi:hypothetical protein